MWNEIVCGNCLDELKKLPSDSADMSFADPPFNLDKQYDTYKDKTSEEDYLAFCHDWLKEMIRITKPTGNLFVHNIPKWLMHYGCMLNDQNLVFRNWISWDALGSPMGNGLQPAHYGILWYALSPESKKYELRSPHRRCRKRKDCNSLIKDYGGKKHTIHPFGALVSDVWTDIYRVKHGKYKSDHPCQLPILLLERLILLCTDENDIVVDPFLGTGTTAISAKRLGRRFWGCDLAEKYVEMAQANIDSQKELCQFNGIWASCYNYPTTQLLTVREVDIVGERKRGKNPPLDGFKNLFSNWPKDDDETRAIDYSALSLTPELRKKVKRLTDQFKA